MACFKPGKNKPADVTVRTQRNSNRVTSTLEALDDSSLYDTCPLMPFIVHGTIRNGYYLIFIIIKLS